MGRNLPKFNSLYGAIKHTNTHNTHTFLTLYEVDAAESPISRSEWRVAKPRETNGSTRKRFVTRESGCCLPSKMLQTVGNI